MRGIGQWAKDIENGTNADFTARWANMFHRRMIGRGKHEAEADLLYTVCDLLGREIDAGSQGLQHIGTAATAGSGAIAVLRDGYACRCRQNARACGNVKCTGPVTASPTGIYSMYRN